MTPLENCKLMFVDEIFACEKPGTQLTAEDLKANPAASPVKSKFDLHLKQVSFTTIPVK